MKPQRSMQRDVILGGPYALGFLPDKKIAACTHLWRQDVLTQTMMAETFGFSKPQYHWAGVTLSLVNLWSRNYFHWVLENLTQAVSLPVRYLDRVIIPPDSPAYIWDSLEMLNLAHLVVEWHGAPTRCETLISFGPIRVDGRIDPWTVSKLRAAFHVSNRLERSPVYISRSKAGKRRILNEAELIPLLEKHGFTVVHAEDITFFHQLELFGFAGTILGAHGAGLVNMVWAPAGCRIIELSGEPYNPCFAYLAEIFQDGYERIDCEQRGQDLIVDLAKAERILQ